MLPFNETPPTLRSTFASKKTRVFYTKFCLLFIQCTWPQPHQRVFQIPASPVMEGIIDFHHDLMFFLLIILGFVIFFLSGIASYFINVKPVKKNSNAAISLNNHQMILEIIWTLLPALILLSIVLPSFALIYSMDEFFLNPRLTIKAIGNQWYWSYNYGGSLINKLVEDRVSVNKLPPNPESDPRLPLSYLTEIYSKALRLDDLLDFFIKLHVLCLNQRTVYNAGVLKYLYLDTLKSRYLNIVYYSLFLDLRGTLFATFLVLDPFLQVQEVNPDNFDHLVSNLLEPLVDLLFAENFRLALVDNCEKFRSATDLYNSLPSSVATHVNQFMPLYYDRAFSDIPMFDDLFIELIGNVYIPSLFDNDFDMYNDFPGYKYRFAERVNILCLFREFLSSVRSSAAENAGKYLTSPAFTSSQPSVSNIGQVQLKFDSYMLPDELIPLKGLRLLEVDKRLILPSKTGIRLLVSSYDVLHSWAVPALGIKLDGCPGRLNQTFLFIKQDGLYYGQCSEICGVNHGFMPIVIRAISLKNFTYWLGRQLDANQAVIDALSLRRLDY